MLETAPESFDENVIQSSPSSIHADADGRILLECSDKRITGELGSLIAVEDLRNSIVTERFLKAVHTKAALHRV